MRCRGTQTEPIAKCSPGAFAKEKLPPEWCPSPLASCSSAGAIAPGTTGSPHPVPSVTAAARAVEDVFSSPGMLIAGFQAPKRARTRARTKEAMSARAMERGACGEPPTHEGGTEGIGRPRSREGSARSGGGLGGSGEGETGHDQGDGVSGSCASGGQGFMRHRSRINPHYRPPATGCSRNLRSGGGQDDIAGHSGGRRSDSGGSSPGVSSTEWSDGGIEVDDHGLDLEAVRVSRLVPVCLQLCSLPVISCQSLPGMPPSLCMLPSSLLIAMRPLSQARGEVCEQQYFD